MAQQGQTCDEELSALERRLAGAAADQELAFMPPVLAGVLHTLVLAIAHTRLMLRRGLAVVRGEADPLRRGLRLAMGMSVTATDEQIVAEARALFEERQAAEQDADRLAGAKLRESLRRTLEMPANALDSAIIARAAEMRNVIEAAHAGINDARGELARALGCSSENTLANLVASACGRISGQAARIAEIERLGEEADQDAARLRVRVSRALGIAGERSDETIVTAIGNLNMALEAWRRAAAEMLGFPQAGKIDADDAMVTALRRVVESAQAPGPKERGALISALGWGSTFGVYTFDDIVRSVRDQRIGRDREREAARQSRERLDSLVSILRAAEPETVVAVAQDRMAEVVSLRARVEEVRRQRDAALSACDRANVVTATVGKWVDRYRANITGDLPEAAAVVAAFDVWRGFKAVTHDFVLRSLYTEARADADAEHRERWAQWARIQPLIRALHAWDAAPSSPRSAIALSEEFSAWQKAEAAAFDAADGPVDPPRQPDDPGVEPEASEAPNLHDTLALAADVAIARIEEAGLAVEIVAMEEGSLGLAGDVEHTVRVRIPRDVIEATRAARKGASASTSPTPTRTRRPWS